MFVQEERGTWDLSPVINLVYALDPSEAKLDINQIPQDEYLGPNTIPASEQIKDQKPQLGNFDEIWKFLGQPLDVPPPTVIAENEVHEIHIAVNDSGTENFHGKTVHWQEHVEAIDGKEPANGTNEPQFTKAQRKKEMRKQRKNIQASSTDRTNILSNSTDEDSDIKKESLVQRSDGRRSIIQQILHGRTPEPANAAQPQVLKQNKVLQRNKALRDVINSTLSPSAFSSNKIVQAHVLVPARVPVYDNALAIAAARKKSLMSKLHMQFVDERQFLHNISILQHAPDGIEAPLDGIHIFVDISNVSVASII